MADPIFDALEQPVAEELSDVQLLQMAAMATGYSSIEPGKCVMVSGSELIAYGYAVAAAARAALAAQPTEPVAWYRSDDFLAATEKRQSFSGWREQHYDCDMALYLTKPPQGGEVA